MKKPSFWRNDYRLDKMGLRDLWFAYFTHYTILVYLGLALLSGIAAWHLKSSIFDIVLPFAAAVALYPFAWYLLHRFVLHGSFLYRSRHTAKVWKRIHFDHHRDPHELNVLFGALYTTLPAIVMITMPIGWLIGSTAGALSAFCGGLLITCFYEFCHCIQHLNYQPSLKSLQKMKLLHLRHHFHDENSNFGITNFLPDKIFGSFAQKVNGRQKSPTVSTSAIQARKLGSTHGSPA